jgi:septal ring factor EnvC (AmiA/AmiB activator)
MATAAPDPPQPAHAPPPDLPPKRRHPWHWIVPCVLLFLIAAGLAIWALSLQSDLDDERAHSAQVEQQAQSTQDDVEAVSDQVDDLEQSLTTASSELSKSTDEAAQNAQTAISDVEDSLNGLSDRAQTARDKLGKAIEDVKNDAE